MVEQPAFLKGLTDMEEMCTSRVLPLMQVRYTKGRQLCYKDHIVNFHHNIATVATKLPRLPEDCEVVVIRPEGLDMTQHVDFIVRADKVRQVLLYKIAHDPAYADLVAPDEEALSQLPENGSVVNRLTVLREGRQNDEAPDAAGPIDAAGDAGGEEGEEPEQFVGGVLNLGNGRRRREVQEVRDGADVIVNGPRYEEQVVVRQFL